MHGNISEPPKMVLTIVREVGADGQDGATEPAGPRLVAYVAVSGRQETGALVAGELGLSGTHAHRRYTGFSCLSCRGSPTVPYDVWARVAEVRFASPGWLQKIFPACFVENGDGSAPPSDGPVAGNLIDLQTVDGHADVVCGDVDGGGN